MFKKYDDNDVESITRYANKLIGKTFQDIYDEYLRDNNIIQESTGDYFTGEAKGILGDLLEKYYFGIENNSRQEPDFVKVGMELKQTCIDEKKRGGFSAGERLSITNISYNEPIEDNFFETHLWNKIRLILLVHYIRDKSKDKMNYVIKYVNRFTPPEEDLVLIMEDYKKIKDKIKAGLAHEISESDTLYLGACTKGSTAAASQRAQYYGNHEVARKRNFCLKRNYMDYVLQKYVLKNDVPFEHLIKDNGVLKNITFEKYINEMINGYKGYTDQELCAMFDVVYNIKNKSLWSNLSYRIFGLKGNHAIEFHKANIVVKSIRLRSNGTIKECISFPTFKFDELVKEEWEESQIYNFFNETKFLFMIYKEKDSVYELVKSQFWNMPYHDLNGTVRECWLHTQQLIQNGVEFTIKKGKVYNNLPSISDRKIIHVRSHSSKSAYSLYNGYKSGDLKHADKLPSGEWMTKQSFWLNNDYIIQQLKL